jgi:hypothetical protein
VLVLPLNELVVGLELTHAFLSQPIPHFYQLIFQRSLLVGADVFDLDVALVS